MKLLAHLIRADIRQFRWAMLLWCAAVVAETVVTGIRPGFITDLRMYANVGTIGDLLWYALQIGMLVIVPAVLQAHPAVGTDAFWMTRPIPPRTLFGAKLVVLAALIIVVPCALRLALLFWIQVPVRESVLVVLDAAIARAAWMALLIAGAAVTPNLPRFALLCGTAVLSVALCLAIVLVQLRNAEFTASLELTAGQPTIPPPEDPTSGVLFLVCVAAAGLALAAIQYRTRQRRLSVPAGVGGLVLAAAAIPYWPVPFLQVPSALRRHIWCVACSSRSRRRTDCRNRRWNGILTGMRMRSS